MVDILISIIAFIFIAFAFPVLIYYCYTSTRARGYRAPGALLLVGTSWTFSFTAVFVLAPRGLADDRVASFILYFFLAPTLAATAGTSLLLRVLPARNARVFGQRQVRVPFVRIGQVLIGLTLALNLALLLAWLLGGQTLTVVLDSARLLIFAVPTGIYLIRLGRRLKSAQIPDDLLGGSSNRIGALYLRSFRQESQFFVIGSKAQYGAYAKSWHATVANDSQNIGVRFDEYFSGVVGSRIGPFVALGCPEDYLAPEGAARLYAKDSEWMERLDSLVRKAACILMEVGSSENLRWELEHIRHEGLQEKLFVVIRPSAEGARLSWWFWNLLWRIKGIRPVGWREFAENMARLGYSLNAGSDPGPGAVVSFDGTATAILLTNGAQKPEDFVEPIHAHITNRPATANLEKSPSPAATR